MVEGQEAALAVALGQPGTVFRYVDTFGVTEQAYPADAQHLNRPNGLFIDSSNNLYVVEEYGARMLKYRTSDGFNLLSIGTAGLNLTDGYVFSSPKDVAVDGSGNIWVVDEHRAVQYDSNGTYQQQVGDWWSESDNTHFNTPRGVAFDTTERMYVSDEWNHRVQVYTFVSGTPVYSTTIGVTGEPGGDNIHFNRPAQIVLDSSDRLFVADVENFRVQRCTYTTSWSCTTFHGTGSEGNGPNELSWAYGLGKDGSGNIYIADTGNARVKKCDSGGNCTTFASGLDGPPDVAVDSSGNAYISYWGDCTIRKYNSGGSFVDVFAGTAGVPYEPDTTRLNAPWGIAVASEGSIYVTENRGYRLIKLNAAGPQQWVIGEAGVWDVDNAHFGDWWAGPEGNLAIDAAGRIFVPDTANHRVQIFNPNGSYFTRMGVTRESGNDNAHFDCPAGVAISPVNGDIYVVDRCNQRIQVFTSSRVYKATLGVTDQTGSDNVHFNWPWGVAVDASGKIYVADTANYRVQKCTLSGSSGTCTTFAGVTGEWGDDFGHLDSPSAVAIDRTGRVYVADQWNNRIQVFDASGAYLTTIGGEWGTSTGEMRGAAGVALDSAGNVYVTDRGNHRIQKFALGVPRWVQVNLNAFGDRSNDGIASLAGFGSYLYAGTWNYDAGGQLWRRGSAWTAVTTDGFGNSYNVGIDHLIEFNGKLYAGTWADEVNGGEVWRSSNGTDWEQVVWDGFEDPTNAEVFRFAAFNNQLYASTWSYTDTHGAEIWRSSTGNSGSWTQLVANGFGDANNSGVSSFEEFNSYLYAGTNNGVTGGEVWRTHDGTTWIQVNTDGFGTASNLAASSFAVFDGYLYTGTYNSDTGGEVWRCQGCDNSDWQKVVNNGFGKADNRNVDSLVAFGDFLYAGTYNPITGMEIWRTTDGTTWEQVNPDGFGDSNNWAPYRDNSVIVFGNRLFIGTVNLAHGGEVWLYLDKQIYLPLILKYY